MKCFVGTSSQPNAMQ